MRDLSDMKGSLESSLMVQGGLLAMAFGGGMAFRSGSVTWLALMVVGVAIVAGGAFLWNGSRKKAYIAYLGSQDHQDLMDARVDASSKPFLDEEIKLRKSSSKA